MVEQLLMKQLKFNKMRRKARNLFNLFGATLCFITLQTFVSCATEEGTEPNKEIMLNGEKLKIHISEESYRAAVPARSAVHQKDTTIDLGNGIIAEMSITPDNSAPVNNSVATRANPMSDGHYTIYVLDAFGTRLMGTDKELSGTVSSGTFVPDHNVTIKLDPGTYTFVCHNDAVVSQGSSLKISSSSLASTYPMIDAVTTTISNSGKEISFTMKHYAARVRTQITTYTAYADMDNNATTFSTASNNFSEMTLSLKGDTPSRATSGAFLYSEASAKEFQKVGDQAFSSIVTPFNVKGSYVYIPLAPGENIPANNLLYNFKGKIYGKDVARVFPQNVLLEPNKSYLIKLNLKSKDPLLLFQDGTVGYIGNKTPERVPVGVVTKEKTKVSDKGTAMALNNADDAIQYKDEVGTSYLLPYKDENQDKLFETDVDGYTYTYSTSIYDDGTSFQTYVTSNLKEPFPPSVPISQYRPKGKSYYLFPVYHTVASYSPGVITTNIGKWFLPTGIQWRDAIIKLFNLSVSDFTGINTDNYFQDYMQLSSDPDIDLDNIIGKSTIPWALTTMQDVFTKSGGSFPDGLYNVAGGNVLAGNRVHYLLMQSTRIVPSWTQDAQNIPAHVRPFVHF